MPKRKRKKYSRPQRPFDKTRIEEENILKDKYGLKNKKEIWKADAAIRRIRNLAKQLITKSEEEKTAFIEKLKKKGFKVESIADALALDKEDWLKRRLQTLVFTKKLATTPKQARQFVAHKQVSIGNRKVNIPSYQVSLNEESEIKLNLVLKNKGKIKEEKDFVEEMKVKEEPEIVKEKEKIVEEPKVEPIKSVEQAEEIVDKTQEKAIGIEKQEEVKEKENA
jgi:small subunit ribosomal protein S4